ncbi:MAG: pseudouridine-5-phosphate glycosidase [Candidatus Cloacimonadota bacterium]|nr:MAG: pseudouridine-5-phosphate glycosidase [Candidatus Cloacimonadota bacterium]
MTSFLEFDKKVARALEIGKPVIALESTIISHGMPYPENLQVAKHLQQIALENGVEPATICLMNGKIKIGLSDAEIKILATDKNVEKVSRRDMAKILARKQIGATTVAATMIAAHLAGIEIFATGGIGGVHRNAENTFDISADLVELSQTPIIVVSAGVKAILDIPKTLEILETFGVPVYGFGTDRFPAFYSSKTDLKIEQINSPQEIANIFQTNKKLGFRQGMLIANPIPKNDEIPFERMNIFIEKAISKANKLKITGKSVTPFLLSEIVKLTSGKALKANVKLVENNVRLACEIAKALNKNKL